MIEYREKDGALMFKVQVAPRASRNEIVGVHDSALRVRLLAAPVDGEANEELVSVLAEAFGVSRSAVQITSGLSSRHKGVSVLGGSVARLQELSGETS